MSVRRALDVVGDCPDPREAWELLVSAFDLDGWTDDPRRRFDCGADRGKASSLRRPLGGRWTRLGGRWHWLCAFPPSVGAGVAFAVATAEVLAAEEIARQAAHALTARPDVVVWRGTPAQPTTLGELVHLRHGVTMSSPTWQILRWHAMGAPARLAALGYAIDEIAGATVALVHPILDESGA